MVNSEYYPAWLDYWGLPHNTLSPEASAKSFDDYLGYKNASVSVYMAHGGTSFGFEAGEISCGISICYLLSHWYLCSISYNTPILSSSKVQIVIQAMVKMQFMLNQLLMIMMD